MIKIYSERKLVEEGVWTRNEQGGKPRSLVFHLPSNLKPVRLLCFTLNIMTNSTSPKVSSSYSSGKSSSKGTTTEMSSRPSMRFSSQAHWRQPAATQALTSVQGWNSVLSEHKWDKHVFTSTHNVIWAGIWAIWRLTLQSHANLEQWQAHIRKQL